MSAHTPTPWVIWDGGICAPDHKGDGNVICLEPDHRMVASCEAWPTNAAFIVLACNSHGELVEALEAIRDLPGEVNMANYDDDDVRALNNAHIEAFHIADAALSKVKAKGEAL